MPAQIYWASLLIYVFGYSVTVLRFSTLILLLVGLIALYHLLRDFGTEDTEASLLTITVFSSPPVLLLGLPSKPMSSFSVGSLLRCGSIRGLYAIMALGSLACFAAVGTRQFGAALVAVCSRLGSFASRIV
jgi:hypothetical protein